MTGGAGSTRCEVGPGRAARLRPAPLALFIAARARDPCRGRALVPRERRGPEAPEGARARGDRGAQGRRARALARRAARGRGRPRREPDAARARSRGGRRDAGVARREIETWFESLRGVGEYSARSRSSGRTARSLLAAGDVTEDMAIAVRPGARPPRGAMSGAGSCSRPPPAPPRTIALHLTVASPVARGRGRRARGGRPPHRPLRAGCSGWSSPGRPPRESAEALLVRVEGERVVVVNEPRHPVPGDATIGVPLARSDDPLVRAALGRPPGLRRTGSPRRPGPRRVRARPADALDARRQGGRGGGARPARGACGAGSSRGCSRSCSPRRRSRRSGARAQATAFERDAPQHDEAERLVLARRLEQLTKFARDMVFLADEQQQHPRGERPRGRRCSATRARSSLGKAVRDLRDPATARGLRRRAPASRWSGASRCSRRVTAARTAAPSPSR